MSSKNTFAAIILLLLSGPSFCQYAFEDAMTLRKFVLDPKRGVLKREDTVLAILAQYIDAPASRNKALIHSLLIEEFNVNDTADANPFIELGGGSEGMFTGTLAPLVSAGSKALGNTDVTRFADGLSKFLVQRVKQELSVTFFEHFQDALDTKENKNLKILFVNTSIMLHTVGRDIYQFSLYLQALREAFVRDLDNLPETFPKVINEPQFDTYFQKIDPPYLRELLTYGLYVTRSLRRSVHPGTMIEEFPLKKTTNDNSFKDVNAALQTAQVFSMSLKNTTNDKKYWIEAEDLKKLLDDSVAFKIYLGLIYEKTKNISFSNGGTLQHIMKEEAGNLEGFYSFVSSFFDRIQDVKEAVTTLADKAKTERSKEDFSHYFQATLALLSGNEVMQQFPAFPISLMGRYPAFVSLADNTANLYLNINSKNYSAGVFRVVTIYDILIASDNGKKTDKNYTSFRKQLIKYGTFLALVAEAKSSDEVKGAIEAVALPVGSASIKKHAITNVALGAYVGPFLGFQKLASDRKSKIATGIFSPVGLSLSTSLGSAVRPGSLTLFFSAIDVGALTTFRFSNPTDTLSGDVKVKLSQIVAPGVHLAYGFPKWPLSIGVGHHWMPLLSKIERSQATLFDSKGRRWQLFVAVDIPLLNFYNKER